MAYWPTLAVEDKWLEQRSKYPWRLYVQLPPQTRTATSSLGVLGIFKQSLENSASHAVADASGTVAASANETDFGTLKLIFSSASVCSLNAPRPFISPDVGQLLMAFAHGPVSDRILTTPD